MADIESLLNRWQSAGVLDAETTARIRTFETAAAAGPSESQATPQRPPFLAGIKWQGLTALILGAILLACGVALFVSAHWDELGPMARFTLVVAVVAVIHIGGAVTREKFHALSTALHAVGTLSIGAAIALVGQIFNLQEHWPSAVLLWALAALAGWALLRDQAQQTLALLLVPAWMACEIAFNGQGHIGDSVYIGRMLFTWAVLYLTFFLASQRKVVQGILFAAAIVAAAAGIAAMIEGWVSYSADQTFIPFSARFWCWVAIASLPLIVAAFHGHKGLIPIAAAVGLAIVLPWCHRIWTETNDWGNGVKHVYSGTEPNLAAYALVAAFAVFLVGWGFRIASHLLVGVGIAGFAATDTWFANSDLLSHWSCTLIAQILAAGTAIFVCWWGIRLASKSLVNIGVIGFAIVVGWFYFSDIFDALGRSLGLIGLGILFLAGGWALEKMRRRMVAEISASQHSALNAAPQIEGGAQ